MSSLPLLKPRPRRAGMENTLPTELNASIRSPKDLSDLPDPGEQSSCNAKTSIGNRTVTLFSRPLSESNPSLSPPISTYSPNPSPDEALKTPLREAGGHHEHILDCSNSSSSVYSSIASDLTLTPPAAPSQSLVVAARKHSNEIREANSTKRRRRRRQHYTKDAELSSVLVKVTTNKNKSPISFDDDEDDHFSWNNRKTTTDETALPFLVAQEQSMSPEERTKQYWEWCYGKGTSVDTSLVANSFSANRMPPSKGCLSNPRPRREHPRSSFHTPLSFSEELGVSGSEKKSYHVQFGSPSAVEYDVDSCPRQLTPMPQEKVRGKYSMTPILPTQEEEEMTNETKHNNSILSQWEDLQWTGPRSGRKSRKRTKNQRKKSRRESCIFSKDCQLPQDDENDTGIRKDENRCEGDEPSSQHYQSADSLETVRISEGTRRVKADKAEADEQCTWEFAANLECINTSGAACTLTESSCSVLDKCRQSEASIDRDGGSHDAGARTLNDSFSNQTFTETESYPQKTAFSELVPAMSIDDEDKLECLYQNPRLEQEQEFCMPKVFQFYPRMTTPPRQDPLISLLFVDPIFVDAVSKSSDAYLNKIQLSAPGSDGSIHSPATVRRAANYDWKRIELSFVLDAVKQLKEKENEMQPLPSFWEKMISSEGEISRLKLDIDILEREIQSEEVERDKFYATLGPRAAADCCATSWLSLFGFELENFDDSELDLRWNHMDGLETAVVLCRNVDSDITIRPSSDSATKATTEMKQVLTLGSRLLQTNLKAELKGLGMRLALLSLSTLLAKLDKILVSIRKAHGTEGFSVFIGIASSTISVHGRGKIYRLTVDQNMSLGALAVLDEKQTILPPPLWTRHRGYTIPQCIDRIIT